MAKTANTKNEAPFAAALDRYFGLAQQGTDVRTEFIARVTTFLTMVYIVFVNPIILGKAGWTRARSSSRPASPRRSALW